MLCFPGKVTVQVDEKRQYQSIVGFGGAFTDSTGFNIFHLDPAAQENLMRCDDAGKKFVFQLINPLIIVRSYFSKDGIGYTVGRVPIAGTDFSLRNYTYEDDPGKPFKLAIEDYLFKVIRKQFIQQIIFYLTPT
jgi:glucosylceramidase